MKRKITTALHVDKSNDNLIGEIKRLSNLELTIDCFENEKPLEIKEQEIYIECYRADGTLAKQEVDITSKDSSIICNLKSGVFSYPGIAEIDLTLRDNEGQMTTASLFIKVTGRVVEVDPTKPENYFPEIEQMVNSFEIEMQEVINTSRLQASEQLNINQNDYENLRRIIITENQAAHLQDQIDKLIRVLFG